MTEKLIAAAMGSLSGNGAAQPRAALPEPNGSAKS
jgi:hypothetical protein